LSDLHIEVSVVITCDDTDHIYDIIVYIYAIFYSLTYQKNYTRTVNDRS